MLRRSHATRNQKRAKDAQMHLGHRSIVTTMNVYAQEIPESVKQMVEEDEALVLKAKQEQKTRKPRRHQPVKGQPPDAPKIITLNNDKCFGIMVSAAGFEPATHALKGHCSTN